MMTKDISEISSRYNIFLIDLYGVIHDGINPFEDAIDAVNYLKDKEKRVIFFSNSPRPKDLVRKKLLSMSEKLQDFEIVTSGEFFAYILQHTERYNFTFLKNAAFVLSNDMNHPLLGTQYLRITDDMEAASYILIIAATENKLNISMFDVLMKKAIALGLPCLCPNPDLIATNGENIVYAAGSFALRYKELGGVVHYIGKPEVSFYNFALKDCNEVKQNIIAIGDNINTDIKGAINFDIDSVLISNGIHKNVNLNELIGNSGITPTYIMKNLVI